jgi:hypothetical protein
VDDLSFWSGWTAASLVVAAALVPLGHRLFVRRRAAPASPVTSGHVLVGFGAALAALLHAFAVLPALGSPASIRGGMIALGPAAAGFFLLFAHVGVGLKLRGKAVRDRVRLRRRHVALALAIAVTVGVHVIALARAA